VFCIQSQLWSSKLCWCVFFYASLANIVFENRTWRECDISASPTKSLEVAGRGQDGSAHAHHLILWWHLWQSIQEMEQTHLILLHALWTSPAIVQSVFQLSLFDNI
jgi:hypothetical protein